MVLPTSSSSPSSSSSHRRQGCVLPLRVHLHVASHRVVALILLATVGNILLSIEYSNYLRSSSDLGRQSAVMVEDKSVLTGRDHNKQLLLPSPPPSPPLRMDKSRGEVRSPSSWQLLEDRRLYSVEMNSSRVLIPVSGVPPRALRFPSMEQRVAVYMGDWYLPPCNSQDAVHSERIDETTIAFYGPMKFNNNSNHDGTHSNGRLHSDISDASIDMNVPFLLTPAAISKCRDERPDRLFEYCNDIGKTMIPLLLQNGDSYKAGPVLLQFGDLEQSAEHGLLNLPHIKKYRRSVSVKTQLATRYSVTTVDGDACLDATQRRRRSIASRLDNASLPLQPIIWKLNSARHYGHRLHTVLEKDIPWHRKEDIAIFRGALSGEFELDIQRLFRDGSTEDDVCMRLQRCRLVLTHANSSLVDAGISTSLDRLPDTIGGISLVKPKLPIAQMLKYTALIVLEGNDISSALRWALLSNSVVLMPKPKFTSWSMEELLEPWVHYIPINDDLTDVEEKMEWIIDHDEEAERIARRATLWMYDLHLHPDADREEKLINREILQRYFAHFVPRE